MSTRNIFSFLLIILSFQSSFSQQYDPIANKGAVVKADNVRFTVLTDRVIRMEYDKTNTFIDFASLTFVNRNLPVPDFKTTEKDGWLIIKTKFRTLHYRKNSGAFNSRNLFVAYHDSSNLFAWKPGMKDHGNLKGTTRTLDGVSGKFNILGFKKIK